jgi:hypothetical protein
MGKTCRTFQHDFFKQAAWRSKDDFHDLILRACHQELNRLAEVKSAGSLMPIFCVTGIKIDATWRADCKCLKNWAREDRPRRRNQEAWRMGTNHSAAHTEACGYSLQWYRPEGMFAWHMPCSP